MKPDTQRLRLLLSKLCDCRLDALLGGSGLLHALDLTEIVNDWDLTTDAPKQDVIESLKEFEVVENPNTSMIFRSDYILSLPEARVEIIGGYAIRCNGDICRLPSVSGGAWEGIPIASPEVWAVAYHLMGRLEKSELLFAYLQRVGVRKPIVDLLLNEPLPNELGQRLKTVLRQCAR